MTSAGKHLAQRVAAATLFVMITQANDLLNQARLAIGGQALPKVQSFVAKGMVRRGFNSVTAQPDETPLPLEIRFRLPDSFLTIVESRGVVTKLGCIADKVVHSVESRRSGATGGGTAPDNPRNIHDEFARFVLAMFADTRTIKPLSVLPDATRRIHVVADKFDAYLDLDPPTKLPLRLRYQGQAGLPQRPLTQAEIRAATSLPHRIVSGEIVMSLADRRTIDGLNIPHKITWTMGDTRLQEMIFETVQINPPLGPEAFR
jgi:hypothetical protein